MADYEKMYSKVRGVTYNDPLSGMARQEIIRRFVRSGMPLRAELETDNDYGDNAIALWVEPKRGRTYHLGYIGSELSKRLAPAMRSGATVNVAVSKVTGGKGRKSRGVNIEIRVYEPSSAPISKRRSTRFRRPSFWKIVFVAGALLIIAFVCFMLLGFILIALGG